MKRVLIAVTSPDRMGYTAEQTGLNLEEFACAYHRFTECNFSVTAASPAGGEVPIDPRSVAPRMLGIDSKRFLCLVLSGRPRFPVGSGNRPPQCQDRFIFF